MRVNIEGFTKLTYLQQSELHSWLCGKFRENGFANDNIRKEFGDYLRICDEDVPESKLSLSELDNVILNKMRERAWVMAELKILVWSGLISKNIKQRRAGKTLRKILDGYKTLFFVPSISDERKYWEFLTKLKSRLVWMYVLTLGAERLVDDFERITDELFKLKKNDSFKRWKERKNGFMTISGRLSKAFVIAGREVNRFAKPEIDESYEKFVKEVNGKIEQLLANWHNGRKEAA